MCEILPTNLDSFPPRKNPRNKEKGKNLEKTFKHLSTVECVSLGQTDQFLQWEALVKYITLGELPGSPMPQRTFL